MGFCWYQLLAVSTPILLDITVSEYYSILPTCTILPIFTCLQRGLTHFNFVVNVAFAASALRAWAGRPGGRCPGVLGHDPSILSAMPVTGRWQVHYTTT